MSEISKSTPVADIVRRHPSTRLIFDRHGLHGCGGENGPREGLEFFARVHQVDAETLLEELRAEIAHPSPVPAPYRASVADTIYRRFFKTGIAIVLSIGALWGAVNLLDIALHKNFLMLNLVPAIHAHAHAMIFGWCGLFVMGFAYQSFPRFKHTTLWRPRLAVATLYLMVAGILLRAVAELSVEHALALGIWTGAAASAAELAAVSAFIVILIKTARGALEPHNPYEKFIFGALFWFFISTVLSDIFFFAKATAVGEHELIQRIALLDGPLRDIQLLGFVTLMIAGVSQRFLPVVYQLRRPRRDRQALIFWLINTSLVLDVACYVLMLITRNPVFALGLEASFVMMLAWAILLVRQLGIFSRPGERDRSWKFVRGSYVWLLVAMIMLPLFPVYGLLTHQIFAHAYLGAYRHAFTVGFVTLMIMGVAARVVPILAGEESARLDSLWGPFLLLNFGNAGRVSLQILSDFVPGIAYSLVGVTGFLEVAALAWWGFELWRTMNRASSRRPSFVQIASVGTAS